MKKCSELFGLHILWLRRNHARSLPNLQQDVPAKKKQNLHRRASAGPAGIKLVVREASVSGKSRRSQTFGGPFLRVALGESCSSQEKINAHSSTSTPVFLPSREETQTMVREQLGPKLRPPQTLYFRGPQMGGQIRRGRIWGFWGAPISVQRSPNTYF